MIRWDDVDAGPVAKGITAAVVVGEQLSAARYLLEAGADVPEHAHDSEEFGQVLSGALDLRVGGNATSLRAGDAFVVPGGVVHSAKAGPAGCELLECYAPPRRPAPLATSDNDDNQRPRTDS